jgi:hypothetical protein
MARFSLGFGGDGRAFHDPGPTPAIETHQRPRAAIAPGMAHAQHFMQQAFRMMEAGDLAGGLQALAKGQAILQQNGVAEDDFSMKIFAKLGETYRALHRKNAEPDPSGIGTRFHEPKNAQPLFAEKQHFLMATPIVTKQ